MIQEATLGAGCFWCIEACFKELNGVIEVQPAYAGGNTQNPSYMEVCSGQTGHAEVARIVFDDSIIRFSKLLEMFWFVHNPTELNRQGNDVGTQYRSVIFYHNEHQKNESLKSIELLTKERVWEEPIVTEVTPINNYYPAEDYHKNYFDSNQQNLYCHSVIRPKVEKFRKVFQALIK